MHFLCMWFKDAVYWCRTKLMPSVLCYLTHKTSEKILHLVSILKKGKRSCGHRSDHSEKSEKKVMVTGQIILKKGKRSWSQVWSLWTKGKRSWSQVRSFWNKAIGHGHRSDHSEKKAKGNGNCQIILNKRL